MGAKVDLKVALNSFKSKTNDVIQTLDGNLTELERRISDCMDFNKKETTTVNGRFSLVHYYDKGCPVFPGYFENFFKLA